MTSLLRRPTALPAPALLAVVTRLAVQPALWRPAVRFDTASRHWERLPGPDGVDVWLLTWLPDQSTELHDHGESAAAFTVLSGAVDETRPLPPTGALRTRRLRAGATRWVPPGALHDVRGSAGGPAVSLHAYSPPLSSMTYYDDALRPVRTTSGREPEER